MPIRGVTLSERPMFWLWALLPAITLLGLWEYAALHSSGFKFFFASPSLIIQYALTAYKTWAFWQDNLATGKAVVLGLFLGSFLGVAVAILFWLHRVTAQIAGPYVLVLGAIPIFSLAPILIVLFGIDLWSKIAIATIGVFFATLPACFVAMKTLAQEHILFCRMINAKNLLKVRLILLPFAQRWILQSLQRNISVAIMGVFIGEFISANRGIAHQILTDSQSYNMPGVWFGIMQFCLLTGLLNWALLRLQKALRKQRG